MVVTDKEAAQEEASSHCITLLGHGAGLANISTEQEYLVVAGTLHAMNLSDGHWWLAGHVNSPHTVYHEWADCEPGIIFFSGNLLSHRL